MSKREDEESLSLPPEDPELNIEASSHRQIGVAGDRIHIEGGINAGRDVIQGDQCSYGQRDIEIVFTSREFIVKLTEIQAVVVALKKQSDLSSAKMRTLEIAEIKIADALKEAQNPDTNAKTIQKILTNAKETFDLLSGSIASAAGLSWILDNLIEMTVQIFDEKPPSYGRRGHH